ncbi:MAG: DUF2505 family protein [Myxococcota bacterium]|nr:DUF2505 family protein [Myxococcota bacterium]
MRLSVEHVFEGLSLPQYEELYFAEDFNQGLCENVALVRELIEKSETNGVLRRVVSVSPDRTIPPAVSKVIKIDKLEYREIIEYELGQYRGTWNIEPAIFGNKFKAGGSFEFKDAPGGVSRALWGDISVKIFGVGGLVEKAIVSEVERSYGVAADFTRDFISARPERFSS